MFDNFFYIGIIKEKIGRFAECRNIIEDTYSFDDYHSVKEVFFPDFHDNFLREIATQIFFKIEYEEHIDAQLFI